MFWIRKILRDFLILYNFWLVYYPLNKLIRTRLIFFYKSPNVRERMRNSPKERTTP